MSDSEHITIREYIERILAEREKALILTAQNLNIRLDHMNARDARSDAERERFVDKDVYTEQHKALDSKVEASAKALAEKLEASAKALADSHAALVARVEACETWRAKFVTASVILIALAGLIGWVLSHLVAGK